MVLTFVLWTIIFAFQKPVFLLLYSHLVETVPVVWHGLLLDLAMAGYLTAVPALCLLALDVLRVVRHDTLLGERARRRMRVIGRVYFWFAALVVAVSFVANIALYGYWQFPLDATPIFFITSSPADAMASVPWWQALFAVVVTGTVAWGIEALFTWLYGRLLWGAAPAEAGADVPRWPWLIADVLLVALLFLPIRGGVTVSTMNTGWAYYSQDQTLNHAAVNPLFSFLESMSHQENFAKQYRYMDDARAQQLAASFNKAVDSDSLATATADSTHAQWLATERPDIYLFILESFSDTVTQVKDGAVTPCLNRLKREGLWFSRFYANSFRTDRGLLSILLGYPSPATVSLMKFPKKTAAIASLPAHLKAAGYDLHYFYGGDADFTNMRSFLINQGFSKITEDIDFPVTDRLSKWGVPDHLLMQHVKKTLLTAEGRRPTPRLWVVQTSSSHEPFDVPYQKFADERLNAFAYADSCVGDFVHALKASGRWQRSLVVLVPDHLGAWPKDADNFKPWRYHIPLIWVGGALRGDARQSEVTTLASQQDIAATLLGQLGLRAKDMPFSKDIADRHVHHYAFFMPNDGFGLVDGRRALIYDHKLGRVVYHEGQGATALVDYGQALVQTLFDDIARR